MSAESMKPNKMKRHFDAKHPNFAGKDVQYYKNKADGVKKAGLMLAASTNRKIFQPLMLHIWWLSESPKPRTKTISEELLQPATKDIVRVMLGAEYVSKLNTISLSYNTVSIRIDDISADIMEQVIQEMKSAPLGIFSI